MRRGSKGSPKWSTLESLAVVPIPTFRKKIRRNWVKKEKNVSSLDTVMSQKAIAFINPNQRDSSSQGMSYSMKMHSGVGKTTLHNIQHHKTFPQSYLKKEDTLKDPSQIHLLHQAHNLPEIHPQQLQFQTFLNQHVAHKEIDILQPTSKITNMAIPSPLFSQVNHKVFKKQLKTRSGSKPWAKKSR